MTRVTGTASAVVDVDFRCVCGHVHRPPEITAQPWARLAGFGSAGVIAWHTHLESAARDAGPFDYPIMPPQPGDRLYLRVGRPFSARAGQPFWCLWEPTAPAFNGWDESTLSELPEIRLVQCRRSKVYYQDDQSAIIEVEIDDVRGLDSLIEPSSTSGMCVGEPVDLKAVWSEMSFGRCQVYRTGEYLYLDHNFEGDIGAWSIVKKDRL